MRTRAARLAILVLLAVPTAGCGTEPAGLAGQLRVGERWVDAVVLHTDLLRGANLVLYPEGRAVMFLGHIGGHTDFIGTWWQVRDRIHVALPRSQLLTGSWHAPVDEDPPSRITLRRVGPGQWRGTGTLGYGSLWTRDWKELDGRRLTVRDMERDLAFVTREAYEDELYGEVDDEVDEDD